MSTVAPGIYVYDLVMIQDDNRRGALGHAFHYVSLETEVANQNMLAQHFGGRLTVGARHVFHRIAPA